MVGDGCRADEDHVHHGEPQPFSTDVDQVLSSSLGLWATDVAAEYYAQRASYPGTLIVTEATFISAKAGGSFATLPSSPPTPILP